MKIDLSRDRAAKQLSVTVAERPGHEVHVGDLGPHDAQEGQDLPGRRLRTGRWIAPMHDMGRVQERLDEIEKRLKDLEKKLPAR